MDLGESAVRRMAIVSILALCITIVGIVRFESNKLNKLCSNLKECVSNIFDNAIVVVAEGVEVGSFSSRYRKEDIIESLSKKYIDDLNINEEDILSVRIVGNITFENKRIENQYIQSKDKVVDDLYNEITVNCNAEEYSIEIVTEGTEEIRIEPNTQILKDEEMYMGKSKIIDGENGTNLITTKRVYINGIEEKKEVIQEKIIKEPVDKVIYKGCKNPIVDNIAFLNNPTKGGAITSGFGARWSSFHSGIDIGQPVGVNVEAAIDGVVNEAGYNTSGYGNLIVLEHDNGMETYYAHLSNINVSIGDTVKKGDLIGNVGNTGVSTGPHLHFELRVNGTPIDPDKYIE